MTESVPADQVRAAGSVLTFLIADLRGYSSFTSEHGDEAAAQLAAAFAGLARSVVAEHSGEVIELRGDECLAVFASTRRALQAAVELQRRAPAPVDDAPALALPLGIGLDAGEAIPVERGYRGAALNLAARLCSLAGPGEVLTSDSVIHLAHRVAGLEYVERGIAQLKGFADPVRVIAVVPDATAEDRPARSPTAGERSTPQQLPIGSFLGALPSGQLVARDRELDRILAAISAAAGGEGRLVLLAGEPGVGKTRLAQEATLAARDRGFTVVAGRCYEPQQTVPFFPFLDVLDSLFEGAPPALQDAASRRWPYLGQLLPERVAIHPITSSQHRDDEQRLFRAVTDFARAIAETGPVAILLDDLHWSDAASLALLQHLVRHTRGDRMLLLGTYRDVEVGRQHPLERALIDLDREGLAERILIHRLGEDGTAALVAATLGESGISNAFASLIHERTDGNPYFVQQVLRVMVERGDVFREGEHWGRRAIAEIEVPASIRAVIGQRLARLAEATQEILREASVLGQRFDFDELQRMTGRDETELEGALEQATALAVIREEGHDGFAFDHALTQQTLYGELSSRRRRRYHLAAGESMESLAEAERAQRAAELAWHFLQADDPVSLNFSPSAIWRRTSHSPPSRASSPGLLTPIDSPTTRESSPRWPRRI